MNYFINATQVTKAVAEAFASRHSATRREAKLLAPNRDDVFYATVDFVEQDEMYEYQLEKVARFAASETSVFYESNDAEAYKEVSLWSKFIYSADGHDPDFAMKTRQRLIGAGYPAKLIDREYPLTSHSEYKAKNFREEGIASPEAWITKYEANSLSLYRLSDIARRFVERGGDEYDRQHAANEIAKTLQPFGYRDARSEFNEPRPYPVWREEIAETAIEAYLENYTPSYHQWNPAGSALKLEPGVSVKVNVGNRNNPVWQPGVFEKMVQTATGKWMFEIKFSEKNVQRVSGEDIAI